MNRNTPFFQRSVSVARKFLQTAVVIDDRAFLKSGENPESRVTQLTAPPTPSTITPERVTPAHISTSPSSEHTEEAPRDPDRHGIDAQTIIDSFAKHGI
jgi:hypothetical protein